MLARLAVSIRAVRSSMLRRASKKSFRRRGENLSSSSFSLAFFNSDDCPTLVLTAGLTSAMRHAESAAVGALYDIGSGELPYGRTSLVTSLS